MNWNVINHLPLQVRFNLGRLVQLSSAPIAWLLIKPNEMTFLPFAIFFSIFLAGGFYIASLRCPACGYQVGRKRPMSGTTWRIWSSDRCCQCSHDIGRPMGEPFS
jgi:hypothetical protein